MAQIAKSITKRVNHLYDLTIDEDLVSFAALAHDIGHPPFGHQGEEALDKIMRNDGGFEGNAQTLRILSKIEKKIINEEFLTGINDKGEDLRVGLNLTHRSLAAILKYDKSIPKTDFKRFISNNLTYINSPIKGYYYNEKEVVKSLKKELLGKASNLPLKTIECSIMDIADDIAYSSYDLEDSFKAKFLSPLDLLYPSEELVERIVKSVSNKSGIEVNGNDVFEILRTTFGDIFESNNEEIEGIEFKDEYKDELIYTYTSYAYQNSNNICSNGAIRTQFTSRLVGEYIRNIEFIENDPFILSEVKLKEEILIKVEVLKTFTYESQILSPKLKIAEYRGGEILQSIFQTIEKGLKKGNQMLPDDYHTLFLRARKKDKRRIICDFIAGMTNKYAIDFYGRLTSENPETIFKPL